MTNTPTRMRELRIEKGLTLREVADYVGTPSHVPVIQWEQGRSVPSYRFARRLEQLFRLPLEDLLPQARNDNGRDS